jgi:hypothetical protein
MMNKEKKRDLRARNVSWMKLLVDAEIVPVAKLSELLGEAEELISVFVSSAKTAKKSG